jgi:membrane carboxypeptidase/penicillin-binding protein PbpC
MNYSVVSLRDQKIIFNGSLAEKAMASANTQTAVVSGLEALLQKTIERMYRKIAPQLCSPPE